MKITKATLLIPLYSISDKKTLPVTEIKVGGRLTFLEIAKSQPRVTDMEINEEGKLVLTLQDVKNPLTLVNTAFLY